MESLQLPLFFFIFIFIFFFASTILDVNMNTASEQGITS